MSILNLFGQYFYIKDRYGLDYLYGAISHPASYLDQRFLSSGKTVCFIKPGHSFWYGTFTFYFLAMFLSVLTFTILAFKLWLFPIADRPKYLESVQFLKKVCIQFFTVGICWLSLILTLTGASIFFDYIFIIFKFFQSMSILYILNENLVKKLKLRRRDFQAQAFDYDLSRWSLNYSWYDPDDFVF